MKKVIYLFLSLALVSCHKEGLDITFRTIYKSSSDQAGKKSIARADAEEEFYTQFGDFIAAITPDAVTAKFMTIRITDQKDLEGHPTIIDVVNPNWADDDPRRLADFTNGNMVEVIPDMFGNIGNDGWFADENIVLKYLGIFPQYLWFEFQLPEQFENAGIRLDAPFGNDAIREGRTMKCKYGYFLQYMEPYSNIKGFVFGGTDTSYFVSQSNIPEWDVRELITMAQPGDVARIANFESPVLHHPDRGEDYIITATISFDAENLIQHYAGYDNVPYNMDDVLVFSPKFWERFHIKLEQK